MSLFVIRGRQLLLGEQCRGYALLGPTFLLEIYLEWGGILPAAHSFWCL